MRTAFHTLRLSTQEYKAELICNILFILNKWNELIETNKALRKGTFSKVTIKFRTAVKRSL